MKRFFFCLALSGTVLAQAQVLTITPPKAPALFTPQFFGVHAHHPETSPDNYPKQPFGAWRMWDGAGTWADVQPSANTWTWEHTDAYVAAIEKTPGTKILLTFGRTPAWAAADTLPSAYGKPGMSSPPADMAAWRAYVRAVATRYKGRIEAYQTGNEVNTTPFFTGTVDKMVEMTCAAYQEIKAVDPKALVVAPSGTGSYPAKTVWAKQFLDAGGAACIDVFAYHLYTSGSPPEMFVQPLVDMRDTLAAAGYAKFPMWNTETGYLKPGTQYQAMAKWNAYERASAVSNYDAADFAIRAMVLGRAIGYERFYWYAWYNGKLGYFDPGSKILRPDALAIRRFAEVMTGATLDSCSKAAGLWNCTFKLPVGAKAQLTWVDPSSAFQSLDYALPADAKVRTFQNDSVTSMAKSSHITLSATPTLFIWK